MVFKPHREQDLINAIEQGLYESSALEARQSPALSARVIAQDIAAMANAGGVIVYGMIEDVLSFQVTRLSPFPICDHQETILTIAHHALDPAVEIDVYTIPSDQDSEVGYLVIVVPASPLAPHYVIAEEEYRFYGRSGTQTMPLSQTQIAVLYERRMQTFHTKEDLYTLLQTPPPLPAHASFGYLTVALCPHIPRGGGTVLDRALQSLNITLHDKHEYREFWADILDRTVVDRPQLPGQWPGQFFEPSVIETLYGQRLLIRSSLTPETMFEIQLQRTGEVLLFFGTAARRIEGEDIPLWIFDDLIADIVIQFLRFMGALYQYAQESGPIDLGVYLTGLQDGYSVRLMSVWDQLSSYFIPFAEDTYSNTTRGQISLLEQNSIALAKELLHPFFQTINTGSYSPFPIPNTPSYT